MSGRRQGDTPGAHHKISPSLSAAAARLGLVWQVLPQMPRGQRVLPEPQPPPGVVIACAAKTDEGAVEVTAPPLQGADEARELVVINKYQFSSEEIKSTALDIMS